MSIVCENCTFCHDSNPESENITCRRDPPSYRGTDLHAQFVRVPRGAFCGEYKPKGWMEHQAKNDAEAIEYAKNNEYLTVMGFLK